MKKQYIITESQMKLLSEDLDGVMRGIVALMSVSIVGGGVWALSTLLEDIGRRAEAGGYKERISTRNEKETLLSAFNLAGGRIDTRIPQLENLKIKFDTYCPLKAAQVGTTNIEINTATYVINAEPKSHLSSSIIFLGKDLDTNEDRIIFLKSTGRDVVFFSLDDDAPSRFGCSHLMVNLFNKKLYQHIVKDLKLVIVDFPIHYKSKIKTDF
jgi:hypothetical protein